MEVMERSQGVCQRQTRVEGQRHGLYVSLGTKRIGELRWWYRGKLSQLMIESIERYHHIRVDDNCPISYRAWACYRNHAPPVDFGRQPFLASLPIGLFKSGCLPKSPGGAWFR